MVATTMSRMALRTFAGPSWKSWTRRANRLRGRMPACLRAGGSMSVTPPGRPGSRRRRRLLDRARGQCLPQVGGAGTDPPVLELEVGGVEESLQRPERRRQEDGEERGSDRDEQRLVGEGVE